MNGALGTFALAVSLLAFTAGCGAPRGAATHAKETSAPNWHGQPLSWEKLRRIETWLAGPGSGSRPGAVPAAELELAQGRVTMARRDKNALSASVLEARLDLAEAGFRRVVRNSRAEGFEVSQAKLGLEEIDSMRFGTSVPAAAPPLPGRILARASWHARPAVTSRLSTHPRPWTRITIHHSATTSDGADAIQRIQKDHIEGRKWGDIGYHFVIDGSGRVYQGRSLRYQGAHADGRNNRGNIGICLLGDFDSESVDPRALRSLEALVRGLQRRHGIPNRSVKGHQEFKATECPGRNLMPWVERYAAR